MQYYKLFLIFSLLIAVSCNKFEKELNYGSNTNFKRTQSLEDYDKILGSSNTPLDKIVDTLLASEKYLKKIEVVQRRLHHLDTSLHDKTNMMLKYLSEMIKTTNSNSPDVLLNTLKALRADWEKFKIDFKASFQDQGKWLFC